MPFVVPIVSGQRTLQRFDSQEAVEFYVNPPLRSTSGLTAPAACLQPIITTTSPPPAIASAADGEFDSNDGESSD